MKQIILTKGKVTLVDDKDFEFLNRWKWYVRKNGKTYYARRQENGVEIHMHNVLLGTNGIESISDHKDHNGLNNQRHNLRVSTKAQNNANKSSHLKSTSKYLGVSWHYSINKWRARISKNRTGIYIGVFDNEIDAAIAYNIAATKIHGEFANLNIV